MLSRDVVERHLLRPDQIAQAQLDGVRVEGARDAVEEHLQREAHAGARHSAVREDGRLVGRHRPRPAAVAFEDVGARQDARDLRRLQARGKGIRGVRAGVDVRLAVDAEQGAVGCGMGGDDVVVLAAVRVGDELLPAVLDPAHGVIPVHREPAEHDLLGEQDALVAESAADVGDDDAHLTLLEPQALREPGAHDVRDLASGVEHEHLQSPVPVREHATALDRRHALARGAERAGDAHRRRALDVAEVRVDRRLEEHVVAPLRVQQRGARLARTEHVRDRGQLLEVERHPACEILRRGPRFPDAGCDRLAGVSHAVGGEHRLLGHLEPGQPRAGDDRPNLGEVAGGVHPCLVARGLVRGAYPGVRERAAHERHVHRARHRDVGDELAASVQKAAILLARQTRSDPLPARHRTFLVPSCRLRDIVQLRITSRHFDMNPESPMSPADRRKS